MTLSIAHIIDGSSEGPHRIVTSNDEASEGAAGVPTRNFDASIAKFLNGVIQLLGETQPLSPSQRHLCLLTRTPNSVFHLSRGWESPSFRSKIVVQSLFRICISRLFWMRFSFHCSWKLFLFVWSVPHFHLFALCLPCFGWTYPVIFLEISGSVVETADEVNCSYIFMCELCQSRVQWINFRFTLLVVICIFYNRQTQGQINEYYPCLSKQ